MNHQTSIVALFKKVRLVIFWRKRGESLLQAAKRHTYVSRTKKEIQPGQAEKFKLERQQSKYYQV